MSMIDRAREIDRRLNAARDPREMKAAITARRLIRAGMAFEHAMEQLERRSPVGPIRESFFVIR
jgi:hypothetical protein